MHFDHVLTYCFGFEAPTARALRAHMHESKDAKTGETETKKLEEFAVRWLAKALGAYGPDGCLGDAVNLTLAMSHDSAPKDSERPLVSIRRPHARPISLMLSFPCLMAHPHVAGSRLRSTVSESALVAALNRMRSHLDDAAAGRTAPLAGLWMPTHLQHDGESDDTLAWLLLERVSRLLGTWYPLRVLAQVGADPRLDGVAAHLASRGNAVFRDDDSRNAEAVLKNFSHLSK